VEGVSKEFLSKVAGQVTELKKKKKKEKREKCAAIIVARVGLDEFVRASKRRR